MSSPATPRRRVLALVLSVVPGWGHVYWGRELLGLSLFTAASVVGFCWLNGLFVYRGDGRVALVWISGSAYVLAFVGAWVELFWRTHPARVERESKEREQLIRVGTKAYVSGDFSTALESFRACLRLQPQDIEALFRLGVISSRSGDHRSARRWLRKTKRYDLEEKWRWEIERELVRMAGSSPAASRPAGSGGTALTGVESGSDPEAVTREPAIGKTAKEEEEAEPASA